MVHAGLATTYHRGRPDVAPEQALEILRQHYGITGTVVELGSQQDRNYGVTSPGGSFVLKVFHDAIQVAVVRDQLAAMQVLQTEGIEAPQPVTGVDGELVQRWFGDTGVQHLVILLTFVEGEQLVDAGYLPRPTVRSLADLAGRVCRGLQTIEPTHERLSQWDLRHSFDVVHDLIGAVPADCRQELLQVAERAWSEVQQLAADLPLQVIHGDITDDNIVARPAIDGTAAAIGVIDFGDLVRSWRIGELAITLASMLHHEFDDLGVLVEMVRAFDAAVGLEPAELSALWPLVQLRCAVLVVSGWQQLSIDPDNEYASTRMSGEWACFEAARRLDESVMSGLFGTQRGPVDHRQLLRVGDDRAVRVLSLAAESVALDRGIWLGTAAEERAIGAAVASEAGVVVVPQGEYRLSRSGPSETPSALEAYSLIAELAAAHSIVLEAVEPLTVVEVTGSSLALDAGDGSWLWLGPVVAHEVTPGTVFPAGSIVATSVSVQESAALHRMSIQRAPAGRPELASFCPIDQAIGYAKLVAGTNSSIGIAEPQQGDPDENSRAEQDRRNSFLPDNTERYYAEPPQIVRGWGAYLVDSSSRVYLDMVNNVAGIGHSHPRLQAAVERELGMQNTNSRFLYRLLADYSERLLATTWGGAYDSVLLVNSGTEAVDLALRMAGLATGRRQLIAHREGYHGWSYAADAVTTSAFDNPNALATRPDWVSITASPNPYRGIYRGEDSAAAYVADFEALVEELTARGTAPAAVIMESILGNSGGVVPPEGYFAGIAAAIRAAGGLSIADEVQVGFGRTGDSFWAAEAEGVLPDIIVCAKAMGNGFPIGAVITRKEISAALGREGHFFSTAGGSPVACAAGLAVLDVMAEEELMRRAREVGRYLRANLLELAGRHPIIGAVHGRGLYQGIELVTDKETLTPAAADTQLICEALRYRGVIDQATSERQNVLKIKPPLTLSRADADHYTEALDNIMTKGWK